MLKNLLVLLFVLPIQIYSQQAMPNCSQLKETTLYLYPRNSTDQYKVVRSKDRQIEYNLETGDSTVYKVIWDDACKYSLTYMSSTVRKTAIEEEVRKATILAHQVRSVSPSYYVYYFFVGTSASDKRNYRHVTTDTAWFRPQVNPQNEQLFKPLTESAEYLKTNFSDTASYAIVYMYRTANASASANEFSVYLDNYFIFRAQNKSRVASKIVKQGPVTFHAKVGDSEAEVSVDIEYGKKYYLSCVLRNRAGVLAPEMRLEEQYDGASEFRTLQTANPSQ